MRRATMKKLQALATWTCVAATMQFGCASETDLADAPPAVPGGVRPGSVDGSGAPQCTTAPQGRSYTDFGGNRLEESRVNQDISANRARLKPFSAMATEYKRVLGQVPASLAGQSGAFEIPPARWYEEPSLSGVGMSTLFGVGFEAATAYTATDARFKKAPDAASAPAECANFLRLVSSRIPTTTEIQACASFALGSVGGLAKEPKAERRWAYVLATALTSSGFLSY
jgi:hypothetical protein